MTDATDVSRRVVLAGGAALAGTVALSACGASGRSSDASTPAAGGAAADSPSTGQPAAESGTVLATLDAIPVGQAVSASLPDGKPVIVSRPSAGTAACFSAICTHMGCTVAPAGTQLHCPCHGSVYNAATGTVISGPAPRPLPKVAVTVANGKVVTAS